MSKLFIYVEAADLVYARVPKVANSSIKSSLAELCDIEVKDGLKPTNDRFWRACVKSGAAIIAPKNFTKRYANLLSFTVVRHPIARLNSCYRDKIVAQNCEHNFAKRGYTADMSFDAFIEHTCALEPNQRDLHTVPQVDLISDLEGRMPKFVFAYENLDAAWSELRAMCSERGKAPPPPLPRKNVKRKSPEENVDFKLSADAERAARNLYGECFELHQSAIDGSRHDVADWRAFDGD